MMRSYFLGAAACAVFVALVSGGYRPQNQTEQEMLAGLRKLARPLELATLKGKDEDQVRALVKGRAKSALDLVEKFEAEYPKSAALNTARGEALKAVGHADDEPVIAQAVRLARRLKRGAPK